MKASDIEACVALGVDPTRFAVESRCVELELSQFSWQVIEGFAAEEDIPPGVLMRHILDQWLMGRIKSVQCLQAVSDVDQRPAALKAKAQRLYFMRKGDSGPIKIGVSANVGRRKYEIQTGHEEKLSVLLVVDQAGEITERNLHKRFAQHRKVGEWFEPCDELLALIERLRSDQPDTQQPEAGGKGRA